MQVQTSDPDAAKFINRWPRRQFTCLICEKTSMGSPNQLVHSGKCRTKYDRRQHLKRLAARRAAA